MEYTVQGSICYITACDKNDVPLFINHGIPVGCTVTIKDNLPHVSGDDVPSFDNKAVLVKNTSKFEARVRVDCDKGICSIDSSIAFADKGVVLELENTKNHEIYYTVDKQGYTTLKPEEESVFYVDSNDNSFYITLQYINEESGIIDICKNYRAPLNQGIDAIRVAGGGCAQTRPVLFKRSGPPATLNAIKQVQWPGIWFVQTGPVFIIKDGLQDTPRFDKRRFRYAIVVKNNPEKIWKSIEWEIVD